MVNRKRSVTSKGVKTVKDNRELQEQVEELRMVVKGLIHAFDFVIGYNIKSIPVTESGNPKFGTFGDWNKKYTEEGCLKK